MNSRKGRGMPLGELAERIGGESVGDPEKVVSQVRPLEEAGPDDLTFVDPNNKGTLKSLPGCKAGGVLVDRGTRLPAGMNGIRIDPPHLGLARVLEILYPRQRASLGVSPEAHIGAGVVIGADVNVYPGAFLDEGVKVGDGTDIYPGVYVGRNSTIGSGCLIHPRVTIYQDTSIGDRVILHSGTVIGADGFGFVAEPVGENPAEPIRHTKIPQVGRVVIEDDVEIGANSTIDRATLAATVIGRGTKIDNLVTVAHNSSVGRHGILVAQSGISGSTRLGNYVTIAGQVGVAGHLTLGDRVVVGAQSGVTKDIEDGKVMIGSPAIDVREGRLAYGLIRRLPGLKKNLSNLQRRVAKLEGQDGDESRG